MGRIAIIKYCKKCPHFSYVFKSNYRDVDDFHCKAQNKWVHGYVYRIHKDCPLEIAKDNEVEVETDAPQSD